MVLLSRGLSMSSTDLDEIKQILHNLFVSQRTSESASINVTASDLRTLEMTLRRLRNEAFPSGYFSDFAWDILLELDKAARQGRRYVVSDAGAEVGIPLTTAVRYIAKMERDGYIEREVDITDRRRVFVSLTEKGAQALNSTFDKAIVSQRIFQ